MSIVCSKFLYIYTILNIGIFKAYMTHIRSLLPIKEKKLYRCMYSLYEYIEIAKMKSQLQGVDR